MGFLKIRSISNGMLATLVICALSYFLIPFCVLYTSKDNWSFSNMGLAARLISVAILVFASLPTLALLIYVSFHYMKRAVISTSGICIKNPIHKDVTIPKEKLTAFGKVHFAPRDTKLYFCDAPSERIWYFFENHLEDCRRVFRNLPYHEYNITAEGRWKMAVGIYVYYRQDVVYFLQNSNEKYLAAIEELLDLYAININTCKNLC